MVRATRVAPPVAPGAVDTEMPQGCPPAQAILSPLHSQDSRSLLCCLQDIQKVHELKGPGAVLDSILNPAAQAWSSVHC